MARGWKTLISTADLIAFARRYNVPLGRQNPTRAISYYLSLGLLPPRHRTSAGGRFRWGFPLYTRALLLRIRDLKHQGMTLTEIRDALEHEIRPQYEAAKKRREVPTLAGLPFGDPVWDYSYAYYEVQARNALQALDGGDAPTARRILGEMAELAEGLRQGKRFLITIGATADRPDRAEKTDRRISKAAATTEPKPSGSKLDRAKRVNVLDPHARGLWKIGRPSAARPRRQRRSRGSPKP